MRCVYTSDAYVGTTYIYKIYTCLCRALIFLTQVIIGMKFSTADHIAFGSIMIIKYAGVSGLCCIMYQLATHNGGI